MSNLIITAKDCDAKGRYLGKFPRYLVDLVIEGPISFHHDIAARGNIVVNGDVTVMGRSWKEKNIAAGGSIRVIGNIKATGNIAAKNNIVVNGCISAGGYIGAININATGDIWAGGYITARNNFVARRVAATCVHLRGCRYNVVDGKLVRPKSVDHDLPESLSDRLLNYVDC
jgi:uncharacterized protein (DUF342 family)